MIKQTMMNTKTMFLMPSLIRPSLQFVLLLIFFLYFGLPAIHRFHGRKVIVVSSRVDKGGIEAPAVTLAARNPESKDGWRGNSSTFYDLVSMHCHNEPLPLCIEQNTFNRTEWIQEVYLGFETKRSLISPSKLWTEDFEVAWSGRTHTLQMDRRIGPDDGRDQLFLLLSYGFTYEVYIHDPDYFVTNTNPVGIPTLRLKIFPNQTFSHYYRLALTEVQELDLPEDPCNPDLGYNFHGCIKESISR